jgi:methyl-accepting chemotaxis protein
LDDGDHPVVLKMFRGTMDAPNQEKVDLLGVTRDMDRALDVYRNINLRMSSIALNAAIEGARLRGMQGSFSVVAKQIQEQSIRNQELIEKLDRLTKGLAVISLRSTAVRYYEMAEDLIDKVDRNLFERNCDVQAWATFGSIVRAVVAYQKMTSVDAQEMNPDESVLGEARGLLESLVGTYVVYADSILLNPAGTVLAFAKNKTLFGRDYSSKPWFKEVLKAGCLYVTDMYFDEDIGKHVVSYVSPIFNESADLVGVLCNHFDWAFAEEMIDSGQFEENNRAFFVNSRGQVIGSKEKFGILSDRLDWLEGGLCTIRGGCGYSIENARNGAPIVVGYARTRGYNAYRGKGWSALVTAKVELERIQHSNYEVDKRTEEKPLGNESRLKDGKIESERTNEELQRNMGLIHELVASVNKNNKEAKLLAINAAIQSGIAGTEGESFAVIADEIGRLAVQSLRFVENVNTTTVALSRAVHSTVSNRLVDAAIDTINKIDRNLFERYCDVQSWTTFEQIVKALEENSVDSSIESLLEKLHRIYEVYHDVFLLDKHGKIVAAAINKGQVGSNQMARPWFQQAQQGKVNFTDVYQSATINQQTIAFSAPIRSHQGAVIGVLTTRFNCNFMTDILKAAIIDSRSEILVANLDGVVVSSLQLGEVLQRNIGDSEGFRAATQNDFGSTSEKVEPDQDLYTVGFAKGSGYNTFPGNPWRVLIYRSPTNSEVQTEKKAQKNLPPAQA